VSAPDLQEIIAKLVREEVARQLAALRPERDEHYTTAEAAAHAKVATRTIRRWIADGKLPTLSAGRELRVRRADLAALMRGERPDREPTPEQIADHVVRKRFGGK